MTIRAKAKPTSKLLLLLPIPLTLLCVFTLPPLLSPTTPSSPTATFPLPKSKLPPHGIISPLLHAQNLSHGAFHNAYTKPYLASLISAHHAAPRSAVIIGFAHGSEAALLRGYDVHAIEPMPRYIEAFRKRGEKHVTLYPFAAGREPGVMEVRYQNTSVVVNRTRGDAVLPQGFAPTVVSADTQGTEFDALLGLGGIMDRAGSVWVEVGCRDGTEAMLRWLDERFVLFDFVPWGKRSKGDADFAESAFAVGVRPDGISEWVSWFCATSNKFKWLQTDLVGVKREIVAEVWGGLKVVGRECCEEGCKLRDLAAAK